MYYILSDNLNMKGVNTIVIDYKLLTYIHYGSEHFDFNLFNPVRYDFKPRGGLWGCIYSEDSHTSDWREWCICNEFGKAKDKHCPCFKFSLYDSCKLLVINANNIDDIPNDVNSIWGLSSMLSVDCKKAFKRYDAVYVDLFTIPNYRFRFPFWDVPSIFVLNPKCVKEVS